MLLSFFFVFYYSRIFSYSLFSLGMKFLRFVLNQMRTFFASICFYRNGFFKKICSYIKKNSRPHERNLCKNPNISITQL